LVLRECPFCHRPFEAELLSKEQVDSSEMARVSDFPVRRALGGQLSEGGLYFSSVFGPTADERAAVAMRPEAFLTYKEIYKCRHCGKEWAKLSVEEIPLPREYVENEEEKTDDDHDEEEEAREEQYAREE